MSLSTEGSLGFSKITVLSTEDSKCFFIPKLSTEGSKCFFIPKLSTKDSNVKIYSTE